ICFCTVSSSLEHIELSQDGECCFFLKFVSSGYFRLWSSIFADKSDKEFLFRLIKRDCKKISNIFSQSSSWREKCVHPVVSLFLGYRFGVTVPTSVPTRDRIAWGSNSHLHFPGGRPKLILAFRFRLHRIKVCIATGMLSKWDDIDDVIPPIGNIVTNSRETPSWRENVSLTVLVKLASFTPPNEDLSDDTTPSVARKFLNEVKSTIMTLQRVVKQRMTIETHNWASSAHQEFHKIVREEIFPIVNQVDARVQNFEIQFLKEAAKFVGDFKSLAKEADDSLAKHKAMELDNERLLKAVVSQDVMNIVQKEFVVDTLDLQTELERTKERFENCIIKKETEYAKLWNDWYKKCNECKYDKISYDKAYKDMQQKIEWLQAQLGDLKGKYKDTSCVSDTQNQLSQKIRNANVELEFQVFNYARENDHLKTTYKNLETKIASLQNELQSNIYKNAKLRTQLFKKAFDHKDNTQNTSANTKFAKQPIGENFPKFGKTNALSKPVTSNSVSSPQEPIDVNNDKVISPGMFRINPSKTSRKERHVLNTVRASARTKPITVSQPHVITKKDVNSDSNGLSSTRVDNTKIRRPKPRSNTKNDRVPSVSKSSLSKNKEAKVEEHHRNLLLSKNYEHMSSTCNNFKLDSQDVISKVVCVVCKKCLNSVNRDVCLNNYVNGKKSRGRKHKANDVISKVVCVVCKKCLNSANHDVCLNNYVNGKKSCGRKHKVNISKNETQQKNQPEIKKSKKVGFIKRLATPKPRKSRLILRWSPTGKLFDTGGKIVDYNGDNACTSNTMEPKIKRFPNSTSLLGRLSRFVRGALTQNDHVAAILGFGDLQWGNILITRVYFIEGLGHNLFSIGQFCDSNLE
nr:integrase, catalytic region, zinc finger, CCHC-type, peptidase aspartic, catalytic [Tanacetum cinerariifolium]